MSTTTTRTRTVKPTADKVNTAEQVPTIEAAVNALKPHCTCTPRSGGNKGTRAVSITLAGRSGCNVVKALSQAGVNKVFIKAMFAALGLPASEHTFNAQSNSVTGGHEHHGETPQFSSLPADLQTMLKALGKAIKAADDAKPGTVTEMASSLKALRNNITFTVSQALPADW